MDRLPAHVPALLTWEFAITERWREAAWKGAKSEEEKNLTSLASVTPLPAEMTPLLDVRACSSVMFPTSIITLASTPLW